jgi:hypothetical protein
MCTVDRLSLNSAALRSEDLWNMSKLPVKMPQMQKRDSALSAEQQIAGFVSKFEPRAGELIRKCRGELRRLLPSATELVYDNYNFFVIGYCSTAKPSSCIVSLAAAAKGVVLSFYYGASLEDPERLLQGTGKQNRFIRLPAVESLRAPGVVALIRAAAAKGKIALPLVGTGATVIQSVSAKQLPRRKAKSGI